MWGIVSLEVIAAENSWCGEAGGRTAWCVQTGRFTFCQAAFCLYCPHLSACWIVSIERGSGVTVCVCSGCVLLLASIFCVCFWVREKEGQGYCTESVGLILLFAPVGFKAVSCFWSVHLERNGSLGQTKLSWCHRLTRRGLNYNIFSHAQKNKHTFLEDKKKKKRCTL